MDLRRDGPDPLHRQIYRRIVELIEEGVLKPRDRLPATRLLAGRLAVNRSTVYRAYQDLWAAGYLESRPGGYTTVRAGRVTGRAEEHPRQAFDWKRRVTPAARRAWDDVSRMAPTSSRPEEPGMIDLSRLGADLDLCPVEDLRHALRTALLRSGKSLLDYGGPAGYAPLRETIARRLQVHGVRVSAGQILITNGAQHGLDLTLRLLTVPGDTLALESPSYSMAIPLARLHRLRLLAIPMLAQGMDLNRLETTMRRHPPAAVYTIPNFHNPTGITTGQDHRERLLALCERHNVPIIEDGFEEEMKYFGKAVLPIKSVDARGIVVYLGTFSKVAFPGLRIGWIAAAEECIERLAALNRVSNLCCPNLSQAAVDLFCRSGDYERYLRRVHRVYRRRMQVFLRSLEKEMPRRGVEWTRPQGGYTLWMRIKAKGPAESVWMEHLSAYGIKVAPGSQFFPGRSDPVRFRLSIASQSEPQIVEGCRRLRRALTALLR